MTGWIGFDLDETLAVYQGWPHIGPPIPETLALLKSYLARGVRCKIMTARVCDLQSFESKRWQLAAVEAWCHEHVGQVLEVTNTKDFEMLLLYDDRCCQVESQTGRLLSPGRPELVS